MQFSNSHFGHGLFDPFIVTFQGQTKHPVFALNGFPLSIFGGKGKKNSF